MMHIMFARGDGARDGESRVDGRISSKESNAGTRDGAGWVQAGRWEGIKTGNPPQKLLLLFVFGGLLQCVS